MAILKIARLGHPVLRRGADSVENPREPEIRALVADMVETMFDADGVGLAAPQVHVPQRVIVFHVPAERTASDGAVPDTVPVTALVNPEIEPVGDEKVVGLEGCLSVPGLRGLVPRYNRVRFQGLTLDGEAVEGVAEGFHARVLQHECDHIDGRLYLSRMEDMSLLSFTEELVRYGLPGLKPAAAPLERAEE